jgi:hypothetical protein
MLPARATAVAAIAAVAFSAAERAAAFDFQRFAALRGGSAAARVADPIALAALQSSEGLDLTGGDGPMARAGLDLALLFREHADYLARGRLGAFSPTLAGLELDTERVLVEAVSSDNSVALLSTLETLGLINGAAEGRMVSGWLPIPALDAASRAPGLAFIRPSFVFAHAGAATSQGDAALAAAAARQAFDVNGAGVTVGVISDSFDCLSGYATDIATADLPSTVAVIEEVAGCTGAVDEGRAMLQIVHDLAPGAMLAFHSGFNGLASFAAGIGALASQAGADVIVDDVVYLAAPMFQDGPLAQAVDSVVALGVPYFSAAGNLARQSYEANFELSSVQGALPGWRRHDFVAGSGTDTLQTLQLGPQTTVFVSLQWDQPFASLGGAGATSDLELVLYDTNTPNPTPLYVSGSNNVGADAVDVLIIENDSPASITRQLAIERRNSVNPSRIKYIAFVTAGTLTVAEHATNSSTVFGHPNAAGARAVGAANYPHTPAYGVQPPVLAPYSSRGGTTIRLSPTGSPLTSVRRKPEIVAVDGVDTRFFGGDTDGSGYPNFSGTSAAAPHAAAIAALGRALDPGATPESLYAALLESAVDMGAAGYDDDSGGGLVQADLALASIAANAAAGVAIGFTATATGTPLASPFASDAFASLGVRFTDGDPATGTSQTALPGSGPMGPISGKFLLVPGAGGSNWLELALTPWARDVRFDFATPAGEIAITGYDAAGAAIWNGIATGATPFSAPDGTTWLAGSVALPASLFLSRVRIAPTMAGAPLGVDNLRFTTAAAPATADVPIPLPALIAAALAVLAGGFRRLAVRGPARDTKDSPA